MTSSVARVSSAGWRALGASVRGASHESEGLPNQDAIEIAEPMPGTIAAAVADGHGAARHFRSAAGARIAVECAIAAMREFSGALVGAASAERSRLVVDTVPRRIVQGWTVRVRAHLRDQPITEREWAALRASDGDGAIDQVKADPRLAYGATLIMALVAPGFVALWQLGDGDALAVTSGGETSRPVPSDGRLAGSNTTSICSPGAERDFRCVVLDSTTSLPALLMLSTDGYSNAFRTDPDFLKVGSDLLQMIRAGGLDHVADRLPSFLREASDQGSGDDISVALLHATSRPGSTTSAAGTEPRHAAVAHRRVETRRAEPAGVSGRFRVLGTLAVVAASIAIAWTVLQGPADVAGIGAPQLGPSPVRSVEPTRVVDLPPVDPTGAGVARQSAPGTIHRPRAVRTDAGVDLDARVALDPDSSDCMLTGVVVAAEGAEIGRAAYRVPAVFAGRSEAIDVKLQVGVSDEGAASASDRLVGARYWMRLDCGRRTLDRTAVADIQE